MQSKEALEKENEALYAEGTHLKNERLLFDLGVRLIGEENLEKVAFSNTKTA
jgi:hypothetical protein